MSFAIPLDEASKAFGECWNAACSHVDERRKTVSRTWPHGPFFVWYKAHLRLPFLEHLSFRLGNQNFFVRVEDIEGRVTGPGRREGLLRIADGQKGHACVMPMRHRCDGWTPEAGGWGLLDARTGTSLNPLELVSDEPIEMTDWELHDAGVQFVCQHLESERVHIINSQGDPDIYHWLQVCQSSAKAALKMAPELASQWGTRGYFAAMAIAGINVDGRPQPSRLLCAS